MSTPTATPMDAAAPVAAAPARKSKKSPSASHNTPAAAVDRVAAHFASKDRKIDALMAKNAELKQAILDMKKHGGRVSRLPRIPKKPKVTADDNAPCAVEMAQ